MFIAAQIMKRNWPRPATLEINMTKPDQPEQTPEKPKSEDDQYSWDRITQELERRYGLSPKRRAKPGRQPPPSAPSTFISGMQLPGAQTLDPPETESPKED